MNREEFEAVLALDGRFELRTQFVRGHRSKGRWEASLVFNPWGAVISTYMHAFAHTKDRAITNLANKYENHR